LTPPVINYARRVLLVKEVHDGDTYRFLLDQGLGDARESWFRLNGIDTWELSQPGGLAARDFVAKLLFDAKEIVIMTYKTRTGTDITSFIRYVADVWVDGQLLQDILRAHPEYLKVAA
jgi:endonuclease YncB( thermonuclease family)